VHDGSLADQAADYGFVEHDPQLRGTGFGQPVLSGHADRYLLADLALGCVHQRCPVHRGGIGLLLAVADASPRPLLRLNPGPDAEQGRGLALVEALTSRWGWHPASATGLAKFTWAEWHLSSAPPGQGGNHAGITRA
jgi:hypothetical protein